jgi:uncharacterized protein
MNNGYYTLITGASRGIGKAIAFEMASRGHNLILNSLPDEDLHELSNELRTKYKVSVHTRETDLTEIDGPSRLFNEIKEEGLKVNILINNAGYGIEGPAEHVTLHDVDKIISLNIRALTILTTLFIPELKKTDSYLLNISSMGAFVPTPYKSVYLASKCYIFYLTRSLEAELKGTSVKTCVIAPSGVRTNEKSIERIKLAGWVAQKSSLSPEEVARKGIRGMFSGKKVIIPGKFTRLIFRFSLLLPEGLILTVTRNMFRREYPV